MRTLRLLGGAAISAVLLATVALGATSTNPIPDGAADRVTGELTDPVHVFGPEPAPALEGVVANTWQYEATWDADYQLPTSATVTMREDLHFMAGPEGRAVVCWGNAAFEDENGYLAGPIIGYAVDGATEVQAVLTGSGAYEGLNAIISGALGGDEGGPIEGLMFEGYLPQG